MEAKVKQLHTNVNGTDKEDSGKELVKRESIEDSPFEVVTVNGESFGAMGEYRLTERGTAEEIKEQLTKITWNRIVQCIMILEEIRNKQIKDKK